MAWKTIKIGALPPLNCRGEITVRTKSNPHPCQGIRVADNLWPGDMRKLPRSPVTFIQAYTAKHIQKCLTL